VGPSSNSIFINKINKRPHQLYKASFGTIRRVKRIINNPNTNEATRQKAEKLLKMGVAPPMTYKKTIETPNGRNVFIVRANNKAPWNFQNNANKGKYTLNNRLENTPTIRTSANVT
jgi:hypothetical protein